MDKKLITKREMKVRSTRRSEVSPTRLATGPESFLKVNTQPVLGCSIDISGDILSVSGQIA